MARRCPFILARAYVRTHPIAPNRGTRLPLCHRGTLLWLLASNDGLRLALTAPRGETGTSAIAGEARAAAAGAIERGGGGSRGPE